MTQIRHSYTIMGATGHVGRVVAERLLKTGAQVRGIGRNSERLKGLVDQGAIPYTGAFDDVEALQEAFKGADGVFAMIPPDHHAPDHLAFQDRIGSAIARALRNARVEFVVSLSSIGAHLGEKTGPIRGLHNQEVRLNDIKDLNVIHLRPAYFMENLLWSIPTIQSLGVNGSSLRGDLPIPMVATRDIGAKAAAFLADPAFQGHTAFEFFGPRPVTMQEVTTILGQAIGKPHLKYVQFPYEEAEKAMVGEGMSPDAARLLVEMNRSFNDGFIQPTQPMTPDHVGTTRIEEFAETFAAAFRAATRK
jgi:uncharacterized protein YbjT (DUF2867 family)